MTYSTQYYFTPHNEQCNPGHDFSEDDQFHTKVIVYDHLQNLGLTGEVCPLYYGHYKLSSAALGCCRRFQAGGKDHRCILLEFVHGYTLSKLKRVPCENEYVKERFTNLDAACKVC